MSWQVSSASVAALLLATVRASVWLLVCPPFNNKLLPAPVKALLALALSVPMMPKLSGQVPDLTAGALAAASAEQVVIGAALGFITALFFAAVQAAGDLVDLLGGFSLASAYDPMSQSQTSVFGRLYNLSAVTLLFASEGHQLVLRGFLQSYKALPLDGALSLERLGRLLTSGVGDMFLAALQIAGPLIAVLFLTDVAFGLLNRVAPALNALSLGFPAKIFLTLALAGTALAALPKAVSLLVDTSVAAVLRVAGG
jgi:flagellar biosynthesis protein FliR